MRTAFCLMLALSVFLAACGKNPGSPETEASGTSASGPESSAGKADSGTEDAEGNGTPAGTAENGSVSAPDAPSESTPEISPSGSGTSGASDPAVRSGVVYVAAGGTGDGSRGQPLGSLEAAFEKLDGGGDIIIDGEYTAADFTEPVHAEPVRYRGGSLTLEGKFTLGGDASFERITLGGHAVICAGTHEAVFARSCVSDGTLSLEGGNLTVAGGDFASASGSRIRLDGGSVAALTLSGDTVTAEINGGTLGDMTVQDAADRFQMMLGGGSIGDLSIQDCGSSELVSLPLADEALVLRLAEKFATVRRQSEVYVCDGGSGGGFSPESAAAGLEEAYALLPEGGTIVLCGPVSLPRIANLPASEGSYTLTSVFDGADYRNNGAELCISEGLSFEAPVTLERLNLYVQSDSSWISFNGHRARIGDGVECILAPEAAVYPSLIGGAKIVSGLSGTDLTVESGTWNQVYGANTPTEGFAANFSDLSVSLTITGGDFYGKVCAMGSGSQTGEGVLTIKGGCFYGGVYGLDSYAGETFDGGIRVNIEDGRFYGKIRAATRYETTVNGSFDVTVSGGDFSHLTDLEGSGRFPGNAASRLTVLGDADLSREEDGTFSWQNPICVGADPHMAFAGGMYYSLPTPTGDIFGIYKAANLPDLIYSVEEEFFDRTAQAAYDAMEGRINCPWPSELTYYAEEEFGAEYAGWYAYFSTFSRAMDNGKTSTITGPSRRTYVLKCTSDDLEGDWVNPVTGELGVPEAFVIGNEDYNGSEALIGINTMHYDGKAYAFLTGETGRGTADFHQMIYLTEMENPWTTAGKALELITPEYDWEREGYGYSETQQKWYPAVVEGIAPVVSEDGRLFVVYCGSGYWTPGYKMGQMTYLGGDILSAESWEKSPVPIFSKSDEVCGVGIPRFLDAPDGKTRYIVYHGYLGKNTSSGRYYFVEPYTVDESGVHIGEDGHPSPLSTTFTMPVNPMPLGEKVRGFDDVTGNGAN